MTKVWSIVVAGGAGSRFGDRKQFRSLGGRPLLEWAVEACRPSSAGVVLVLPADLDDADHHGADAVVAGGATRADSVRCGLAAVPDDARGDRGPRCGATVGFPRLFDAVITAAAADGVDGAVPGVPPSDTIKAVDGAGRVTSTLDRSTLVAVQTPQAFRAGVLRRAHAHADPGATDDAMLVEALGGTVRVVPGEPANLKITDPDDLGAAERLLASRG